MVGQIDRCSVADPDPEDHGLFELRGPDPVYLGPDPPHCLAPTGSEIQGWKNLKIVLQSRYSGLKWSARFGQNCP